MRGVGCFYYDINVKCIPGVSVPLRGVGCFSRATASLTHTNGFRPLAGCGLFRAAKCLLRWGARFPSPCGVWVVSMTINQYRACIKVSVPLRGVGCFGCEMARDKYFLFPSPCGVWVVSGEQNSQAAEMAVSVPLRGVGCFPKLQSSGGDTIVSVPLRGVGCFMGLHDDILS